MVVKLKTTLYTPMHTPMAATVQVPQTAASGRWTSVLQLMSALLARSLAAPARTRANHPVAVPRVSHWCVQVTLELRRHAMAMGCDNAQHV